MDVQKITVVLQSKDYRYAKAAHDALEEVDRAKKKFPADFNSVHEGYAVILEETDELWDECKQKTIDVNKMRKEAVQCAAMCLRFIAELSNV